MKVCRIIGDPFPPKDKILGGLGPNYYYLSKYLTKMGVDIHIIAGGYPRFLKHEEINGIKITRVRDKPSILLRTFSAIPQNILLNNEIKKIKNFDILHFHNPQAIWIQKRFFGKIPIVSTIHNSPSWYKVAEYLPWRYFYTRIRDQIRANLWYFLFKEQVKYSDVVVCVCEAVADEIRTMYRVRNKEKVIAIPNGVELELFYPRKPVDLHSKFDCDFLLLYFGEFSMRKGLKYLFYALKELKNKRVKLLTFGANWKSDYGKYYKKLIEELGIRNQVISLEKIPEKELPKFYSSVDCFVLPSLSEGLPKVAIEALACECPVIATAVNGTPEIVIHKKTGLLVPPKDVKKLQEAIEYAVNNRSKMKKMAREGRKLVVKKYNWERSAKKYYELYKKLVEI